MADFCSSNPARCAYMYDTNGFAFLWAVVMGDHLSRWHFHVIQVRRCHASVWGWGQSRSETNTDEHFSSQVPMITLFMRTFSGFAEWWELQDGRTCQDMAVWSLVSVLHLHVLKRSPILFAVASRCGLVCLMHVPVLTASRCGLMRLHAPVRYLQHLTACIYMHLYLQHLTAHSCVYMYMYLQHLAVDSSVCMHQYHANVWRPAWLSATVWHCYITLSPSAVAESCNLLAWLALIIIDCPRDVRNPGLMASLPVTVIITVASLRLSTTFCIVIGAFETCFLTS